MSLPERLLLVSDEPLNRVSGTGVTMDSLFSFCLPENRLQVWDHPVLEPVFSMAAEFVRISTNGKWRGGELDGSLKKKIRQHAPEALYCAAVSPHLLQLTCEIVDEFQLPLIFHLMDDWPRWNGDSAEPDFAYYRKNYWFDRILRRANIRLAISDLMKQEYEERTSLSWRVAHHRIDFDAFQRAKTTRAEKNDVWTIGYIGSLRQLFHGHSFEDLLEVFRERKPANCRLVIHSLPHWMEEYRRAFKNCANIQFCPPVSPEKLPQTLASFDALFLPMTFDPAQHEITRLSLPTKLGEYLASGTPILSYGPADAAPQQILIENKLGECVTQRNKEHLFQAMMRLRENSAPTLVPPELRKAFDISNPVLESFWSERESPPAEDAWIGHRTLPVFPCGYLPQRSSWDLKEQPEDRKLEFQLSQTAAKVALLETSQKKQKVPAAEQGKFVLPLGESQFSLQLAPAWKPSDAGLPVLPGLESIAGLLRMVD